MPSDAPKAEASQEEQIPFGDTGCTSDTSGKPDVQTAGQAGEGFNDGTDESDYMYEPLRDCAWYALTNPLDDDSAECKRIRNVYIRFCLEAGANLSVQVLTDNGQKREVGKFVGYGQRRRMMRVNVLPCTSLQFLLSGSGMCTIQEIGFEYEQVKGEDAYDQ